MAQNDFARRGIFAAAVVAAACRAPTPSPRPRPTDAHARVPTSPVAASAEAATSARVLDGGEAGSADASRPGEGLRVDDAIAWLVAHGSSKEAAASVGAAGAYDCSALDVGAPAVPALFCSEVEEVARGRPGTPSHVYRVLAKRTARVVRAARPVVVLDVVIAVGPLDREEADQPNLVDLLLRPAADGLAATLVDDPSRTECPSAGRDASPPNDPVGAAWDRFDRELVAKACRARGRYVWKSGRFVRDAAP